MWIQSEERTNLLNTIILNGPMFYMSLAALMGVRFTYSEGAGPAYKIFMVFIFLLGIMPFCQLYYKMRYNLRKIFPLSILAVYIIVGLIQLGYDDPFFLQMVCFAIPPTCIAMTMNPQNGLSGIMKWMDLLLPLFSLSFVFMVINIYLNKLDDEGNYDQSASYFIAFCFLVDVYLLRYKNYYHCFHFLDKKWYTIFKILLLPYFVVVAFFGGGRGAFLTIIIGVVLNLGVFKKLNLKRLCTGCLITLLIVLLGGYGLSRLNADYFDLLTSNFERIYAVVEGGHIDTSASSGRDTIWADALKLWLDSPLYGFGLFSYLNHFYIRPHNIFIEMLLQGGILLLLVFCFILVRSVIKYWKMLHLDKKQIFLMPFIIYCSTILMLSGSYWFEPFFWFVLSYINFGKVTFPVDNKVVVRYN